MVAGAARGTDDERFAFGENWRDFSKDLDEEKVSGAREGVVRLLGTDDLTGKTFLDVGCGSGLMSLAAHQLGAAVTAFDYDPDSVATSIDVRDRYGATYPVMQGSALDADFVTGLGTFDVVYSWGVLHHTGDMWRGFDVVTQAVAPGGTLALAIYNDQGLASRVWTRVKKAYVEGGPVRRRALLTAYDGYFQAREVAATRLLRRESATRPRGMDRRHDLVDWIGGYPFEVAKPEEVFRYFRDRGFVLRELTTCRGGLGCNEFVFDRTSSARA
jgi:2-polyprenyl-3-methyl-5-hydroxy-6-metoxy-1,4-benzoquinol methylase